MIRLAADGELSREQSERLDAHLADHPEGRLAIDFEHHLRDAVCRVMTDPIETRLPDDLEFDLTALLDASDGCARRLRLAGTEATAPADWEDAPPVVWRRRRWNMPSGLAAGLLFLVGSALIVGVLGNSSWFTRFWPQSIRIDDGDLANIDGDFVHAEHERCATDAAYASQRLALSSVADAQAFLSGVLGWPIAVPELGQFGYAFAGAGDCSSATPAVSGLVHFQYAHRTTDARLSVFVQEVAPADLGFAASMEPGKAYRVYPAASPKRPASSDRSYFAWRVETPSRDQGFAYRLVPAAALNARAMAVSLGMPDVKAEEVR